VPLYHLGNHRGDEQYAEMVRLEGEGICIFCPAHQKDVVHRGDGWTVLRNDFPYRGTVHHLLLVPDQHVTDLVDLDSQAQRGFWTALRWARETYTLSYYGIGARNGDPSRTGGTIYHLHIHLVVGDVDDPGHEPVRMKLSSRPAPPR
jgi:diadenosine tetraphosphate (Ap4A) HIT family hydrolase